MNDILSASQANSLQPHFGIDARVIAAIDFGTSHSGYAMVHIADTNTVVEAHYQWKDQPAKYSKNLTAILYAYDTPTSTPTVEAWGYTARKNGIKTKDETHRYVSRFKLYLDEDVTGALPPLPPGQTVLNVIADYLRNLYAMALKDIHARWGGTVKAENVVWFLTVPAMWTEKAKQQMREAAVIAGLVSEDDKYNPNRLNIVLEPEAAAMFCCQQSQQNLLSRGETFMIVDAGGGTIDLTVHEVQGDSDTNQESLREISHGSGKSCGSTFIDEAFIDFVKMKCGAEIVEKFRETHMSDWLRIMKEWEEHKRAFNGDINSEEDIPIPMKLRQMIEQNADSDDESDADDDFERITITAADFFGMFNPIVNSTLELIELQLERSIQNLTRSRLAEGRSADVCKIDKMFFVGGFSDSEYLWKKAQEKFGARIQLFRPIDPGSAVVKGAVLCGKFPRFISSRRSRIAYGVKTSGPWTADNPAGESAKKWIASEGTYFAENLFHAIVNVDELVGIDETKSTVFVPVATTQDFATLELYTTDLANEKYMLPSMILAGTVQVPLSRNVVDTPVQLPVRIQFVQDVSTSMRGIKLHSSKEGLKRICRKLSQGDEVGLIKFGDIVKVVSAIKPYANSIHDYINLLEVNGMTALYNAISMGIRSLKERAELSLEQTHQNVLLIATDGEENSSGPNSFADIETLLQNPPIANFRLVLATAGNENIDTELVKLFNSEKCKAYCEIINVDNSSEGIKEAYIQMDQKVQLLKSGHSLASINKSIKLEMKFGATEVSADAFVANSGVKKSVTIKFHGKRSN